MSRKATRRAERAATFRKRLIAATTAAIMGLGLAVGGITPATASGGGNHSNPNNASYYVNNPDYPNVEACYYHGGSGSNVHGSVTTGTGGGVTLNAFNPSWNEGDRWELLVVKGGNEGREIYLRPSAGILYQTPTGQSVSHWIVCKGTAPVDDKIQTVDCTSATNVTGRPLVNGDHINMRIQYDGREIRLDSRVDIANRTTDPPTAGGLLVRTTVDGVEYAVPLTLEQIAGGLLVVDYASYLDGSWSVIWVQYNERYAPELLPLDCGEEDTPVTPAATSTPENCLDGDGSITFADVDGIASYSVQGQSGTFLPGSTLENLEAGTYTISAMAESGFVLTVDSSPFTVEVTSTSVDCPPVPVTPAATSTPENCLDGDGSITFADVDGIASYSVQGQSGTFLPGSTLENLEAGTYTVSAIAESGFVIADASVPFDVEVLSTSEFCPPTLSVIPASASAILIDCNTEVGSYTFGAEGPDADKLQWTVNGEPANVPGALIEVSSSSTVVVTAQVKPGNPNFGINPSGDFTVDQQTGVYTWTFEFEVPTWWECDPPVLEACTTFASERFTELGEWDFSETRSTGRYEIVESGLRVWTEGATSTDKVAGYLPVDLPLMDLGTTSIADMLVYDAAFGIEPGINLVIDFDGNGTPDGILVGESIYGENWWLANASAQFVKDAAPNVGGGNGSEWFGTAQEWLTEFPEADIVAAGFSLGSGVYADGVIKKLVIGCTEYTFGLTPLAVVDPFDFTDTCVEQNFTLVFVEGLTYTVTINDDAAFVATFDGQPSKTFPVNQGDFVSVVPSANPGYILGPDQPSPLDRQFAEYGVDDCQLPELPNWPASATATNQVCTPLGLASGAITVQQSTGPDGNRTPVRYYLAYGTAQQQELTAPVTSVAPGSYTVTAVASISTDSINDAGNTAVFPVTVGAAADQECDLPTLAFTGASGALQGVGAIAVLLMLVGFGAMAARRQQV